jgi:hypothetical protein
MCPSPPAGTLAAMNPKSQSRARGVTVIAAVAGLALLTAACGSSPSSTASGGSPNAGGTTDAAAIAYTQCMHSHGVPAYPYPDSSGDLPKFTPSNESQLGVSDAQFNAAGKACQSLWPYQAPTQAQEEQELTSDLKFARCMRANGLPNFPDPITTSSGQVEFVLSISKLGANPESPLVQAKAHACEHQVVPGGTGLPVATLAP